MSVAYSPHMDGSGLQVHSAACSSLYSDDETCCSLSDMAQASNETMRRLQEDARRLTAERDEAMQHVERLQRELNDTKTQGGAQHVALEMERTRLACARQTLNDTHTQLAGSRATVDELSKCVSRLVHESESKRAIENVNLQVENARLKDEVTRLGQDMHQRHADHNRVLAELSHAIWRLQQAR